MKQIKLIMCAMVLFVPMALMAHEISGTIKDEDGKPIDGAGVYNQTNGSYVYTDMSGYYELEDIDLGDVLLFHSLGYVKQELTVEEIHLDAVYNVILVEEAISLDQVVLVSKINALNNFVNIDVKTNPVKSAQEIVRKVPGIIIGQHGGGGKAEQFFLRGFDIDHGTDLALSVDGLPVNMVSHAHGQGYADLHFIIPETIEDIDFGKGPYYTHVGNFNTAGYVALNTKKKIDNNQITVEGGQFNTVRALGMLKISESDFSNTYVASELLLTDGVFDSPQNFNRINILGRYNFNNYTDEELTISLSHFQSRWNQSGQIPQRAVDQGLISRFGAIDDTEGGNTSRSNIWVNHFKQLDEHQSLKTKAFLSKYTFELFSNFTFFLNDPVNGDQIQQVEDRTIIGAETVYGRTFHTKDHDTQIGIQAGLGFRYDDNNDVQLSRTRNRREILSRLSFGDVDEVNAYSFINADIKLDRWTINPGLRMDYFNFAYDDFLNFDGEGNPTSIFRNPQVDDFILSPKLNFIYSASPEFQVFLKNGFGFHSNDARVVTDPVGEVEETLPSAFGSDLGIIAKPLNRLLVNAGIWYLALEQEFVFVGDEAVVEPSGRTRRYGGDFGLRYQINNWLFANFDINYTIARSIDDPDGEDFIPLAPDLTSAGGLSVTNLGKFSGNISYRYIDDRPANEDDSLVAEGYFVTDMNLNYNFSKNWTLGIIVENLFDVEWNETQFATETRLFDELESVEEITFTPGAPFFLRGRLSITF
ncbi:MAG: TonB-dependent receptor [Bacteroidota bacterium]